MSRIARLVALVAALTMLPASAALAHPSLNPNAVPDGEPVDTTLVIPHGCSSGDEVRPEEEDSAVATTRIDLQRLDGVEVEPQDVDGWDVTTDDEAVSWTDAGGATTDPIELPITLTVHDGEPGDQLHLAVFQECEDGQSYRWTEGSEDTPPVRLELTAGETGRADQAADSHTAGETAPEGPTAAATEEEPTEATAEPTATEDTPAAVPLPDSARASSFSPVPWLVVAVFAAALAAGIVWARRKGAA